MVRVGRAAVARHLHPQLAAVEHGPVHGVHGVLGVALVVEPDEGEASGLLGVAVPRDVHVADAPVLLEDAPQGVRRGAVGQVVHLEGGHALHIGRRAAVAHGGEAARRPLTPRLSGTAAPSGPRQRSDQTVLVGQAGAAGPPQSNLPARTPEQQLNRGRDPPRLFIAGLTKWRPRHPEMNLLIGSCRRAA